MNQLLQDAFDQYPLLTKEEEQELSNRAHQGDLNATNKLALSNLRYLVKIVQSHYGQHSFDDTFQNGFLGLMRTAQSFDPKLGCFTTLADLAIKRSIVREHCKNETEIKAAIHFQEMVYRYKVFCNEVLLTTGTMPKDCDTLKKLKISPEQLQEIKNFTSYSFQSIDEMRVSNENSGYADTVSYTENYDAIDSCFDDIILFYKLRIRLTPLEYYLIYYNVLIENPLSAKEIAEKLGTYRQIIEQKNKKIHLKIKNIIQSERWQAPVPIDKLSQMNLFPHSLEEVVILNALKQRYGIEWYSLFYEHYFYAQSYLELSKSLGLSKEEVMRICHHLETTFKKMQACQNGVKIDVSRLDFKTIKSLYEVSPMLKMKIKSEEKVCHKI